MIQNSKHHMHFCHHLAGTFKRPSDAAGHTDILTAWDSPFDPFLVFASYFIK